MTSDWTTPVAIVQQVIEWLRPLFESAGYVVVTCAMFLESAAFTGIVVPGDVILAVGGVYASNGTLTLGVVMTCGVLAALAGQTAGFVLGRRYGKRVLAAIPFLRRFDDRLERLEKLIERRGGVALVLGRFATGVAGLMPFVAGTSGVGWGTFLRFSFPITAAWAIGVVLLGSLVGNNIELIDRVLSTVGGVGLAVLVFVAIGIWGFRKWRRRAHATS